MPEKLDYLFIKSQFEKKGCILKSNKYVNSTTKLDYICPNGHEHSISWSNFKNNHGCATCLDIERRKNMLVLVDKAFKKRGWVLKSKVFINQNVLLDYICDNGHQGSMSWNCFTMGRPCQACNRIERCRKILDKARTICESKGWDLISEEYKDAHTKLDYICEKGHKGSALLDNLHRGCGQCEIERKRHSIEYIKEGVEGLGWTLKDNVYVNAHVKLDLICPNGHDHRITWNDLTSGYGCPFCPHFVSEQEKEIQLFLTENNVQFDSSVKSVLINPRTKRRLELDIYFPDINKAIEFNGEYWHSLPGAPERDKIKQDLCKEKGINLMIIMYNDWKTNEKECKDSILSFVNEDN